jgi:outer membrane lipase/esterase
MLRKQFKLQGFLLACALAVCCGLSNIAQALPFTSINQIYFFGDSLSDSGFFDLWPTVANPGAGIPTLPAGKAPTFTTFSGYTWSQYIARDIKGYTLPVYPGPVPANTLTNNSCCVIPGFSSGSLTGVNYAAGGSTTNSGGVGIPGTPTTFAPSLTTQVQTFLNTPGRSINENDVFFVWSGANDFIAVASTPSALPLAAKTAATNIAGQVALLSSRGAKKFVVLALPNIGSTPFAASLGDPKLQVKLNQLVFLFNSSLNQALGSVIKQYGVKILFVNVPLILTQHSYQFSNTTSPVCGAVPSSLYCTSTSNGYLFADSLHPTDMAHYILSQQIKGLILNWAA